MKRADIISYLALLTSVLAIAAVISTRSISKPQPSPTAKDVDAIVEKAVEKAVEDVRKEMADRIGDLIVTISENSAGVNLISGTNGTAMVSEMPAGFKELQKQMLETPGAARGLQVMMQQEIKTAVLDHMADKLDDVDWDDTLSQEKLQKMIKKASRSSSFGMISHSQTPIDVSDVDGIENKIDKILEEFEGVNSYSSDNQLVKQMAEMGEDAIAPLLAKLTNLDGDHKYWAVKSAITGSLSKLLTEEHKEIILEQFEKNNHFAELIKKYQFPEAEDAVINKIRYPEHGHIRNAVIDAAIILNAERAIPYLREHVKSGRNVWHAAQKLSTIPGLDIREELKSASERTKHIYERQQVAQLCLERGMPEGFDLAIAVLRSNEDHSEHSKQSVSDTVRKHSGISGSYKEVADWLEQNQNTLQWSPTDKVFKQ